MFAVNATNVWRFAYVTMTTTAILLMKYEFYYRSVYKFYSKVSTAAHVFRFTKRDPLIL